MTRSLFSQDSHGFSTKFHVTRQPMSSPSVWEMFCCIYRMKGIQITKLSPCFCVHWWFEWRPFYNMYLLDHSVLPAEIIAILLSLNASYPTSISWFMDLHITTGKDFRDLHLRYSSHLYRIPQFQLLWCNQYWFPCLFSTRFLCER